LDKQHGRRCLETDVPIAGLLKDLKARGLLDSTLVVWGGEFGRTPFNEKGTGRDHNPWGFSMWMAGGGAKPGVVGATDEIGLRAVDKPYHVNDLHATILHLMGLNHLHLTYFHNGRHERPTINAGMVMKEVLA
jgi:arylsulfatase A-like enzyme